MIWLGLAIVFVLCAINVIIAGMEFRSFEEQLGVSEEFER
jgi:hypothetical protein